MIFKDYYKILELHNSKVSSEEIRAAYREQAKKYHPDVNVGSKVAEERFKDINEAYRVLSTPASRRKYDRMWNNNVGRNKISYDESTRQSNSIFSDFFNMFFGNINDDDKIGTGSRKKRKNKEKGEDIETSIDVSIEDAFYGKSKKISLRTVKGDLKNFDVKIPAGILSGEKIRLIGQGKQGINGGNNGDLFIKINIKDNKKFCLKGYDIYTSLYITPWEAALGTKAFIQGIDEETGVYIPEGTQSGQEIKINGKGYKDSKGGRGDLIAEVKVMVPTNLTESEKVEFQKLKEISVFNPRNIY